MHMAEGIDLFPPSPQGVAGSEGLTEKGRRGHLHVGTPQVLPESGSQASAPVLKVLGLYFPGSPRYSCRLHFG